MKVKNTNSQLNRSLGLDNSPQLSPLERPQPNHPNPKLTNDRLDAGSSSYLGSDSSQLLGESGIDEDFFRYNYSQSRRRDSATVPPGVDFFNLMSDELILRVFRWLSKSTLAKCARVCKTWHRLSADESLWRRLDLGLSSVPAGVAGQVIGRGCSVLRLARATMEEPVFSQQGINKARLQYLDLSSATVMVTCLEQLLTHCSLLRNLSLEMCSVSDIICAAIGGETSSEEH